MNVLLDRVNEADWQGWGGRDWSPNQGGYNEDLPCLASSATWDMSADQITYFTLEIFTDARVLGHREKGKHEWI